MHKKFLNHIQIADPILYEYALKVEKIAVIGHIEPRDYFVSLCREIVGQQLSGKAANAIFTRFLTLFSDRMPTAQTILNISDEAIRNSGIFWSKVRSLKNLAETVLSGKLELEKLPALTDEEVIEQLIQVKGIGRWTAEMFLMFALGREDVFSHGDLGLKNAIQKMYGFKTKPSEQQVNKIIKKWSPYKTYAAQVLWKSLLLKTSE